MRLSQLVRRARQKIVHGQKQVEKLSDKAGKHLEQHFFNRFERLLYVRRFVIGWMGLLILLIIAVFAQDLGLSAYYQTLKMIPGGIYTEGVYGRFTNANPIYATSEADRTISRLVFASLFVNGDNGKLQPVLASSYSVNSIGTVYTIHLRPHLLWQDGKPLTSSDVAYTYHLIQNPNALSPLESSWQGVQITTPNPLTIVFTLPDPLASFPYSLTTGILPRHILSGMPVADLRSADFNTIHMVGSGPFSLQGVQVTSNGNPSDDESTIALKPFVHYALGKPKLHKFIVDVYANSNQLIQAFQGGQLTALDGSGISIKNLSHRHGVIAHDLVLRAANMVFFKMSSGVLADQQVRQALISGANVKAIVKQLGYKKTPLVREPFLKDQFTYNPTYAQADYNPSHARALLSTDGWQLGAHGIRSKQGQSLAFTLTAANTQANHLVVSLLQKQWQAIGVRVSAQYLGPVDFQNALTYHQYQALLNGISIGIDPDVFVYWASSQASINVPNDLNFSQFQNSTADSSLEAGRTRLDPALRVIEYQPFLQAWQQYAPALGLYQPRLLYLTNGPVQGLENGPIVTSADRFNNVQNWEILQARVTD